MEEGQNTANIAFSVDAGLINRLGLELVGRAETAVSELIKNAYDADATVVEANFINSYDEGGSLEIIDNGIGMTFEQLKTGFMTISSTDKLHNPLSNKYNRSKAGRKGIGRFATQRLGSKLTIITYAEGGEGGIKVTIDWNKYDIDNDITEIVNPVEIIPKGENSGTKLVIENLRDGWTEPSIKRIYRYVSDLFQPDYLSQESLAQQIANQKDNTFKVRFYRTENRVTSEVASPQKMLFDKRLAVIEGYVDKLGDAFVGITSESLGLDNEVITIDNNEEEPRFSILKNVHFKAYYFIYNRAEYYSSISKMELRNIQTIASDTGGIRLYRNGFRVLPYGEPKDDWLGLDIRYSGVSGQTNIPFSNNNLFGFVEILDKDGISFQETASREGLIENRAFRELVKFLHLALVAARGRIAEKITILRQQKIDDSYVPQDDVNPDNEEKSTEEQFDEIDEELSKSETSDNSRAKAALLSLKQKYEAAIEELSMLRILATLGLTIGEFTHEIIQYTPDIHGYISKLFEIHAQDPYSISILNDLKRSIDNFTAYTSYFNATISENTSREIKPINIEDVTTTFVKSIRDDLRKKNIEIVTTSYDYDLHTIPMHISEWSSIFYNLYTNSKKAIKRQDAILGKISVVSGIENDYVYVEFSDNGDGIPNENRDRIFNAFFTTSTPVGFEAPDDERLTGTGLGLKIVKDIVTSYKGRIFVIEPPVGFNTCFRIEIPKAPEEILIEYGI